MSKKLVIAIDGPAGAGKSTTAKLLAQKLGYLYLDTGAMYRAITLKALRQKIDEHDEPSLTKLAENTDVILINQDGVLHVLLDGEDVTDKIRTPEIDRAISYVCRVPLVRKRMVELQRQMGKHGGIVAEGRDIGTVVFPKADLKIFLVASVEERGKRRWKELRARGVEVSLEQIIKEIQRRDKLDSSRELSPLKKAPDAIEVDTTQLTIPQQVEVSLQKVKEVENSSIKK